jgi:hypothetical protein
MQPGGFLAHDTYDLKLEYSDSEFNL